MKSSALPRASLAWLWLCLVLALIIETANRGAVFPGDGIVAFVDADCYARMTRVREVSTHWGRIIHWHDFENYPIGIRSHATALFDYAIAWPAVCLRPLYGDRALDFAGAWISPVLGLSTLVFLWQWAERLALRARWALLLIFAASPIVAHGFALGRPDHQSLILALMAAALAAEWAQWRAPARRSSGWYWSSAASTR